MRFVHLFMQSQLYNRLQWVYFFPENIIHKIDPDNFNSPEEKSPIK